MKATEVKIGEFIDSNLESLFKREERLEEDYENYCRQHNRKIKFSYFFLANALYELQVSLIKK